MPVRFANGCLLSLSFSNFEFLLVGFIYLEFLLVGKLGTIQAQQSVPLKQSVCLKIRMLKKSGGFQKDPDVLKEKSGGLKKYGSQTKISGGLKKDPDVHNEKFGLTTTTNLEVQREECRGSIHLLIFFDYTTVFYGFYW